MKKRIQGSYQNSVFLAGVFLIVSLIGLLAAAGSRDNEIYFATPPSISNLQPDKMNVEWNIFPQFNHRTHYQVQVNHELYGSSLKITRAALSNLEPGGTYDVSVITYHEGNVAGVSSPTKVLMAPATPKGITLYEIGSASFKIIWQRVNSALKYRVYRFPDILLAEVDEPSNKAEIHGLAAGEAFNVYVAAVNETGESYQSKALKVQLLPPPPTVAIVEDEIGPTWFSMKWSALENAKSYTIYINEEEVAQLASDTFTYRAENLPIGTAVSVKMKAENSSGDSEISEPIIVQLLPATPVLAVTEVSSYSCTLQWSVANGATYYKVYEDKEWCIYNLPSTINQVVITQHVTAGMTATYTIKAGNGTGESEHSSPVVVTYLSADSLAIQNFAADSFPGLLYNMNDRLGSNLRGKPMVSVYFPDDLDGAELALEASFLESLSALPQMNPVKFIGVFTHEAARIKAKKRKNMVWKISRGKSSKYELPGHLPLVRFYDSQGWLRRAARVSMAIMTPEDVLRELPEIFEQNAELTELYREEKEHFNNLHDSR